MAKELIRDYYAHLIAKLEAAKKGTPDLDREVQCAVSEEWPEPSIGPFYTQSLDAALTLVPEGWGMYLTMAWRCDVSDGFATCGLCSQQYGPGIYTDDVVAATPALALCIAALEARQALALSIDADD